MRIISLVPSATEILYLLGLGEFLLARSHDSNYPPEVAGVPVVSDAKIDADSLTSREIDEQVRRSLHTGRSLFHLDQKKLARLKPTLIFTQELCEVCAPSFDEVKRAAKVLKGKTQIVSLEPHSIAEMLENILLVGQLTGVLDQAKAQVERLGERLERVRDQTSKIKERPRVVVLEWLEPLMSAGHWVPEMVELAGGVILLSEKGEKSKPVSWEEVLAADPDFLIVAPCGFDTERTKKEMALLTKKPGWENLKAVKNRCVHLMDGDAYLTRSGPRLVDGVEVMAQRLARS